MEISVRLAAGLMLMSGLVFAACDSSGSSDSGDSTQNIPRFAYAANYDDDTISCYTVDAGTGRLRHNGYVEAGTNPRSVCADPWGRFLYAPNRNSGDISVYTIDQATGRLTAGTAADAGEGPVSIAIDGAGKFA
ncbi:MAG TPA: beta-propeller fold lactonase family protein, partial [Spirochaetota bacterium]|nr:beta-propeller fold lactonase family protein [Spirochaetota bacterium]